MDERAKKELEDAIVDALQEAKEGKESQKNIKKTCLCRAALCAKCLGSNCQDKDCPVHTKQLKEGWRDRWEKAQN